MKLIHSATVRNLSETEAHHLHFGLLKIRDNEEELCGFEQDGFWHVAIHDLRGHELLAALGLLQEMGYMEVLVISREL